jgi:hypothetical protein
MNERKRVQCGKGYCALDYSMFFLHNQWHPSQIDPPVFETRAKSLKKKKGGEKNRDGKTGGIIGGGKVGGKLPGKVQVYYPESESEEAKRTYWSARLCLGTLADVGSATLSEKQIFLKLFN